MTTEMTPAEAPAAKISAGGVKKARNEGLKVVTANDLLTGAVVYLTRLGRWTEELGAAAVAEGDEAMALLERGQADEARVVGPYLMDVDDAAPDVVPSGRASLRELIRRDGPTIHPQFARRAPREEPIRVSVR